MLYYFEIAAVCGFIGAPHCKGQSHFISSNQVVGIKFILNNKFVKEKLVSMRV